MSNFVAERESHLDHDIGSHLTCSSHVAKTGDIKDFVITEESGIAKGIRRLVAVTGQEAQAVTRAAEVLKSKLEAIENADGKDKDAGLKALNLVRSYQQSVGMLSFTCNSPNRSLDKRISLSSRRRNSRIA